VIAELLNNACDLRRYPAVGAASDLRRAETVLTASDDVHVGEHERRRFVEQPRKDGNPGDSNAGDVGKSASWAWRTG